MDKYLTYKQDLLNGNYVISNHISVMIVRGWFSLNQFELDYYTTTYMRLKWLRYLFLNQMI